MLLLPLAGAIISLITAATGLLWLRHLVLRTSKDSEIFLTELARKKLPLEMWIDGSIEREIESLIDKQLERLIGVFKEQIPMTSMFLTKSTEEKLKGQAYQEMIKMVPYIKQYFFDRCFSKEPDYSEVKTQFFFNKQDAVLKSILGAAQKKIFLCAILLGLALGCVEMIIFSLLNICAQ